MVSPYNRPDGCDYSVQIMTPQGRWDTRFMGWCFDSTYVSNLEDAKRLYSTLAQQKENTVRLVRVSRYGLDDEHPIAVEVLKYKGATT